MDRVGDLLCDKLLIKKPDVVLEHFKTEKAVPLMSTAKMQQKLYSTVERHFDSLKNVSRSGDHRQQSVAI